MDQQIAIRPNKKVEMENNRNNLVKRLKTYQYVIRPVFSNVTASSSNYVLNMNQLSDHITQLTKRLGA